MKPYSLDTRNDFILISEMSIFPDTRIKMKIMSSIHNRLSLAYNYEKKEWLMAELRCLHYFHKKELIFIHIDKGMLLNKVNAFRESAGLYQLDKLNGKNLRTYLDKNRNKVYSYYDFDAHKTLREILLFKNCA